MKLNKKIITVVAILAIMLFASIQFVFASDYWSDAKRYQLNSNDGWKMASEDGTAMGSEKTSDNTSYQVYTVTKTMWSSPKFRLVNSNNVKVSGEVETAPEGRIATGGQNAGQRGYAYYGSVKPGWNQINSNYIKLQMKIY